MGAREFEEGGSRWVWVWGGELVGYFDALCGFVRWNDLLFVQEKERGSDLYIGKR